VKSNKFGGDVRWISIPYKLWDFCVGFFKKCLTNSAIRRIQLTKAILASACKKPTKIHHTSFSLRSPCLIITQAIHRIPIGFFSEYFFSILGVGMQVLTIAFPAFLWSHILPHFSKCALIGSFLFNANFPFREKNPIYRDDRSRRSFGLSLVTIPPAALMVKNLTLSQIFWSATLSLVTKVIESPSLFEFTEFSGL